MKLRGINFGNAIVGADGLNFFGNGWWYHKIYKELFSGFNFTGSTFVAKTTTWEKRIGNMPLKKNLQPKELKPSCILVYFFKAIVLNSVGLAGPGAPVLFGMNKWQKITKPFFLSYAPSGETKKDRLINLRLFVWLLKSYLPYFKAKIGLQINVSCPNTEHSPAHSPAELSREVIEYLEIASVLGIPSVVKFDYFTPIESIIEVANSEYCDAIECFNSFPVNKLSTAKLRELFNRDESPLHHLGGGGMSGDELLIPYTKKIQEIKKAGVIKPIIGGGGITDKIGVFLYKTVADVDAIAFCSATMTRPYNIRSIINMSNQLFGGADD